MHKQPIPCANLIEVCRHAAAVMLALLALTTAPAVGAAQNRVALVIGNADYLAAPLKNPENDARDMAAKLEQVGFDVVLRENLKIRDIGSALREFRARLSPGDEALFFYNKLGTEQVRVGAFITPTSTVQGAESTPHRTPSACSPFTASTTRA